MTGVQTCALPISCDNKGVVPQFWNDVKKFGEQDIFDIVFIANVFSHHKLVDTMIDAIDNGCVIERSRVIDGKEFTNFAHTIEKFGYFIEHTSDYISFDISRIFYKYYLNDFIKEIFRLKLLDAGWEQKNNLLDEAINNNFHKVFGLDSNDFKTWLEGSIELKDEKIANVKAKRNFQSGFKFSEGHNSKFEGEVEVKQIDRGKVTLIHNLIQNKVFEILTDKFPSDRIGTENASNTGSIDLVRESGDKYYFYEIKTTNNTRINIRQALSQLLEYAYWNDIENIERLIIIAPSEFTPESEKYLKLLRERFGLPIFYQYYDIENNKLSDPQ